VDPDPAIFVIDLPDANKNLILKKSYSAYYFLKANLHQFSKTKSPKKDPDPDPYLSLMDPDPDPGGPETCGSGSLCPTILLAILRDRQ
jgi:hypothetical protein